MRNPLRRLTSTIAWLRAGYSNEAPRTGHSPLIALNGPVGLSDKQIHEVVESVGPLPVQSNRNRECHYSTAERPLGAAGVEARGVPN